MNQSMEAERVIENNEKEINRAKLKLEKARGSKARVKASREYNLLVKNQNSTVNRYIEMGLISRERD